MPQISVALEKQLTATRVKTKCSAESIEPSPSIASDDPVELVYNIRTDKFRTAYRSILLTQDLKDTPMMELRANMPPLLCDGRMIVIEIRKWRRTVDFLWRTSNGVQTKVRRRVARLPIWVWMGRNFGGKWTELWIERG